MDSAPPAPMAPGAGAPPLVAGQGAADASPQDTAKLGVQQVMNLGNEVDRALLTLAGLPDFPGAKEIGQARQLIQAGIAKYVSAQGEVGAGAAQPTEVGARFPGGGFSSIR